MKVEQNLFTGWDFYSFHLISIYLLFAIKSTDNLQKHSYRERVLHFSTPSIFTVTQKFTNISATWTTPRPLLKVVVEVFALFYWCVAGVQ
jgi:hypothetical protein